MNDVRLVKLIPNEDFDSFPETATIFRLLGTWEKVIIATLVPGVKW